MLRSLWFRLTGTVLGLVIFTLALSLIATLVIARNQFAEFVENTSDEIISITAPTGLVTGTDSPVVEFNPNDQGVRIVEPDGGSVVFGPDGQIGIEGSDGQMSQIDVQIPAIVQSQSSQLVRDVGQTILTAASISTFLAMVAGTWLFWQITRPLTRLRDAAEKISTGDLNTRVQVKSKDEVGRVGLAFNHMAGQLQRQEGLRKQMVADIAHELRTPLSVMQVNLEAMADDLLPVSPEELDGLHHEVQRLSRLVEDLRLLSLADAGNLELIKEPIDVNDLAETAVRRLSQQAAASGIFLTTTMASKPVIIEGDEDKLHQVLANLVSNALRFTPSGNRVEVRVKADKQWAMLEVADEGTGIDSADLPNLFERFYKGDKSRTRGDSGSGLGLSIVKQLVELHGGRIEAALPKEGGLLITIRLPFPR